MQKFVRSPNQCRDRTESPNANRNLVDAALRNRDAIPQGAFLNAPVTPQIPSIASCRDGETSARPSPAARITMRFEGLAPKESGRRQLKCASFLRPAEKVAMVVSLAELIRNGLSGARLFFGVGGGFVVAERLAESGSCLFSDAAPASAAAIVMTNDQPTVEILLGAVLCGTALLSLPTPGRGDDLRRYALDLHKACIEHRATQIVARDDIAHLLQEFGVPARGHSDIRSAPLAAPTDFTLTQSSSGSTALTLAIPASALLGLLTTGVMERR